MARCIRTRSRRSTDCSARSCRPPSRTTCCDENPVRIKGASAEQMIERPLLTWDDVRALAGAIHPRFECLVWTAAASGLRFGELAGLSVDHVNLNRSELRVSRALNDIKGVGPTIGPPTTNRAVRTSEGGRLRRTPPRTTGERCHGPRIYRTGAADRAAGRIPIRPSSDPPGEFPNAVQQLGAHVYGLEFGVGVRIFGGSGSWWGVRSRGSACCSRWRWIWVGVGGRGHGDDGGGAVIAVMARAW